MSILPAIKGFIVRMTCPLFFRSIGKECRFYGRIRLPQLYRNINLGRACMIGDGVFFHAGTHATIDIGDSCGINTGCHIVASELIQIGTNVAIGEYVTIRDQEHKFAKRTGARGCGYNVAPINIGDNSWIGRGVYIGPGVEIGAGCVVGANSVVKGQFPANVLIAGSPAVIKRTLDDDID